MAKPYQSPYTSQTDQLSQDFILGQLTGQGVSPSPALNNAYVAQQLGGKYDTKSGEVRFPDGSAIKFNPITGQYDQVGGSKTAGKYSDFTRNSGGGRKTPFQSQSEFDNWVSRGGAAYDMQGNPYRSPETSPYATKANEIASGLDQNLYNDPNSVYGLFKAGAPQAYNAQTGRYEDINSSSPGQQLVSGEDYLKKYGGFLDQKYSPSTYKNFDYSLNPVASVSNVSSAARDAIYNKGKEGINTQYRDAARNVEDYASNMGSSLSSGRQAKLKQAAAEEKNRSLMDLQRNVDTEHELRNYTEAQNVRNMQEKRNEDLLMAQGQQNQTAQAFNQGERQYGFSTGQQQGAQKLQSAEAINSANRDRAFQELQAERQQKANQTQSLYDLLRIYGGMDATTAQLQAAQANALGSAFGSIAGAAGKVFG